MWVSRRIFQAKGTASAKSPKLDWLCFIQKQLEGNKCIWSGVRGRKVGNENEVREVMDLMV